MNQPPVAAVVRRMVPHPKCRPQAAWDHSFASDGTTLGFPPAASSLRMNSPPDPIAAQEGDDELQGGSNEIREVLRLSLRGESHRPIARPSLVVCKRSTWRKRAGPAEYGFEPLDSVASPLSR